jgi:glycosyltransferase involved in cell wall biosynthesis
LATSASNASERAPLKVGVIADFREERWPSMDLITASLMSELAASHRGAIEATLLRPTFRRPLSAMLATKSRAAFNAERALNRYVLFPLTLRRYRRRFDLFHIIDHSYAHLVNYLPSARTIVTCHDLDAFRCLLEPAGEPRPAAFRAMIRHVLRGLRRAACVTCVSDATRDALLKAGLRTAEDLVTIANGVDDVMFAEPAQRACIQADAMLGPRASKGIEILHVGNLERRKRIDLVLRIFAAIAARHPRARLIRVGGPLRREQAELAQDFGVADKIVTLPFLEREVLTAIYRRADLMILPSEAEGFGMPVLEALAAGTAVLASDVAALREVGDDAVQYCAIDEIDSWVRAAEATLRNASSDEAAERRHRGSERARQFTWRENASRTVAIYGAVAARARVVDAASNPGAASRARNAAAIEPIEAWNPPHEGR